MRIEPPLSASMPADHDVLAEGRAALEQHAHQRRADALAAPAVGDVHGVLDREAVAGPGAEVAEGGEAGDRRVVGAGDQQRIAVRLARLVPRLPLVRAWPAPRGRSPSRCACTSL